MPQITLNGKTMQTTHTTLDILLNEMALSQGRFAVEVNGNLVPKSQFEQFKLENNMVIEVVRAVGGG